MEVTKTEIIQIIKDAGIAGDFDALDHDTLLRDNGVDSLDMANILLTLEEKYSIKISDEDVDKLFSINAIAEYLSDK